MQTGTQILTGFLLTLPFQQRFSDLQAFEKDLYLITLAMSTAATIVLVSPVAMHRLLFRRHALPVLVENGGNLTIRCLFNLVVSVDVGNTKEARQLLTDPGFPTAGKAHKVPGAHGWGRKEPGCAHDSTLSPVTAERLRRP